jgi:SepF-like predicted cell division protein (DUF552 family)
MYHVGKTVKVFSPDNDEVESADEATQAALMMWDENLLTTEVSPKLSKKIREGDIVIVDYTPISDKLPAPKMIITKILRGNLAEKTWRVYKDYYEQKKRHMGPPTSPPPMPGYR